MCLSADEVNPLCDECFSKLKEAGKKGIGLKDEDMCDECGNLPKHFCFCCDTDQRCCEHDLGVVDGVCKRCRET